MSGTMKKSEVLSWMGSHAYSTLRGITEKMFEAKEDIPTIELKQYMRPIVWRELEAEVVTHVEL